MFRRIREWRGPSILALLVGLVLLGVSGFAIGVPISEAVSRRMLQRRADYVAQLPIISSAAQLAEARDGDEVLLEGRISPSNRFRALRTWARRDNRYVVHDGRFAAYWTQHVRPVEGGVLFDPHVIRSVPSGLRVQVAAEAEVTIQNADFKTEWERGYDGSISGHDLPPPTDLVVGFELDELVTVQGRMHHGGGKWTVKAEYVLETTAAHYVRTLAQEASEARALARGFSSVLSALALVVGVPCLIGGILAIRRSCG
jgi:hypothetical protein